MAPRSGSSFFTVQSCLNIRVGLSQDTAVRTSALFIPRGSSHVFPILYWIRLISSIR